MLRFPEPREFRLGYSASGSAGHGSGRSQASAMASLIQQSISDGVDSLDRWERLPLFNEGIGPDLVSDIVANVLKHRFIEYTSGVCQTHGIAMRVAPVPCARFDWDSSRWETDWVDLPHAPDGRPIILAPRAYLKPLQTVSWEEFRDYAWDQYAESVARDFGYQVKSDLDKKAIVRIARARRDWVSAFVAHAEETTEPYDLAADPLGHHQPYVLSRQLALAAPQTLTQASGLVNFGEFMEELAEDFRHFIEDQRGSRLLWNDDGSHKQEIAAQLTFMARAEVHCQYNDVHIVGEADLGKGPVDFEFATGYRNKGVLEIKLMCNSKYWHGLEVQLPRYMKAARAPVGQFLGVGMKESYWATAKVRDLPARTEAVRRDTKFDVKSRPVQGWLTESASR